MSLLKIWSLWRKVKPWLEHIRPLLAAIAGLFKTDPNAPKQHGAHDPDKPTSREDIERGDPA